MKRVVFSPVSRSMAYSSLGYAAACRSLSPCDHSYLASSQSPGSDSSGAGSKAGYKAGPKTSSGTVVGNRTGTRSGNVPVTAADPGSALAVTAEIAGTRASLWSYDVIFVSCAWELEVPRLAGVLARSGIAPFAATRPGSQPLIIGGGPLTLSNPDLLASVCDAVFIGEADNSFQRILTAVESASGRRNALESLAAIPGMWVPSVSAAPAPSPVLVRLPSRPLTSVFVDQPNEFSGAFIVETGRGCPRGCSFCVAFGGRRASFFDAADIVAAVPEGTVRAGLLGAAVSDHPRLAEIVRVLLDRGTGSSLGSLRADRVSPELVSLLVAGGLKTLTIAVDGPSESLRRSINKGVTAEHVRRAAAIAGCAGIEQIKLYVMVGLPGETSEDIAEFGGLAAELSDSMKTVVSVSPFVPKRFTPLEGSVFAGTSRIRNRISELKKLAGRHVEIRAGSVKQAETEHLLSNVRLPDAAAAVIDAMERL